MSIVNLPSAGRLQAPRPCVQGVGPKPCQLMIIGEAPGAEEEKLGIPFVGAAGRLLDELMREAGLTSAYKTNVLSTRPINNDLKSIFVPALEYKAAFGAASSAPYKIENKLHYLPPAFESELTRLHQEIDECNPNLILALGNTALWSLTGRQNISSLRGTVALSSRLSVSRKLLPTFHPAAVLRQWDLRTIVLADMLKAGRQALYPEIRRPRREILCNPTLMSLEAWLIDFLAAPPSCLAVDVETKLGQITEIGFAGSSSSALVIPLIKGFNEHYWPTLAAEVAALRIVQTILQSDVPKVFQNGLYDIQYIWKTWRFPPRRCEADTMIRHHALFPEMQKGLGFLGSLYTDEPAWKLMRLGKETEGKKDDE